MLVLPTLHTYLSQLLSPPSIHTALLLTPEGALVSYASQMNTECSSALATSAQSSSNSSIISGAGATLSSPSSTKSTVSSHSKPDSVANADPCTGLSSQRSKDEIRMVAGLGAEVWAETREEVEGMVESELGRILVLAVEDESASSEEGTEPLLLLAVNGTTEADWDTMRAKGRKLATFLAPSVNRHRGTMGATATTLLSSLNGSKNRTHSTATSPGRGANR